MKIEVKDSEWYREVYNMPNRVTVYVGETKAEHDARVNKENRKHVYDMYYGYAGFDEHPDSEA